MAAVLVTWCGKAGIIELCTSPVVIGGGRLLVAQALDVAAILVTWCVEAGPIELWTSHVVIGGGRLQAAQALDVAGILVTWCEKAGPIEPCTSHVVIGPTGHTIVTPTGPACSWPVVTMLISTERLVGLLVHMGASTAQLAALDVHSLLRQGRSHLH